MTTVGLVGGLLFLRVGDVIKSPEGTKFPRVKRVVERTCFYAKLLDLTAGGTEMSYIPFLSRWRYVDDEEAAVAASHGGA